MNGKGLLSSIGGRTALGALLGGLVLAGTIGLLSRPAATPGAPAGREPAGGSPTCEAGWGEGSGSPTCEVGEGAPERPAREACSLPLDEPSAENEEIHRAVEKGLRYLAHSQSTAGAWIEDIGYKFNDGYVPTDYAQPDVGVSSLALMAFLSGGYLPGRGQYGKVVERGTDFVLSCVDPESGYISAHHSRMYSHAFACLFLAEIFGMTHRADVRQKLQLAINMTVDSQNIHGSWRYEPNSPDSDMSITVCQIMALRAARNIGIKVPKSTIDRAYNYVINSAIKDRGQDFGGFKYQEKETIQTRTSFSLTAAGVATLHNTGTYDHVLIKAGIDYLKREFDSLARSHLNDYFFWYGNYYASQVFFTASDGGVDHWNNFYWKKIPPILLREQIDNGSWKCTVGPGPAFSTAVACIILQIPYQYLPIFQR